MAMYVDTDQLAAVKDEVPTSKNLDAYRCGIPVRR